MSDTSENKSDVDLENMEFEEIVQLKREIQSDIQYNEKRFKEHLEDRRNQIEIVKTLREMMKEVDSMDEERRELLNEFNGYRKKAEELKKIRDLIDNLIPPPSKVLEKWIMKNYENLTLINNDLTTVPTLEREKDLFEKFFELQICIKRKREAEKAHLEYRKNMTKCRKVAKKLDTQRKEKEENVSKMENKTEPGEKVVSRKEISKISKKISSIDKKLDELKLERNDLKSKLLKTKKLLKKKNLSNKKISLAEIKTKIDGGEILDISEFGVLLDQGSLSDIKPNIIKKSDSKNKANKKRKMRRFGNTKRKSRKGNSAALRGNE
jgi:chromosome segregation ATPase